MSASSLISPGQLVVTPAPTCPGYIVIYVDVKVVSVFNAYNRRLINWDKKILDSLISEHTWKLIDHV